MPSNAALPSSIAKGYFNTDDKVCFPGFTGFFGNLSVFTIEKASSVVLMSSSYAAVNYTFNQDCNKRNAVMGNKNLHKGFSKLKRNERLEKLLAMGLLTAREVAKLKSPKLLPFSFGENFIENLIGYYQMPLGVAVNFKIDDQSYVIPMAVEETSVIAAASKTAKWINEKGKISTATSGSEAIGQIQIAKVKNFELLQQALHHNKQNIIAELNNNIASSMVKRGGGVRELAIRRIPRVDGHVMAVIHVMVDTCDAMGANIINQICEYLRHPIEQMTNEKVNLCILSNLTDKKITTATVIMQDLDFKIGKAIEEASLFAEQDPYRAATNNKGVLNGMDAVAIATGNDWRALEAGIHAYAARNGQYSSITQWKMDGKNLIGTLTAPINVGIVGGVTQLHPIAKICLKILNVENAAQLARIMAAVGLVQNLGALRALTTEGICRGHMRLHINNLCLAAGAKKSEIAALEKQMEKILLVRKKITVTDAIKILKKIRKEF